MVLREQLDHRQRGDLTSIAVWRKGTDLSIQDIHTFNRLRGGVGPHNSQWHKLELNKLEPYLQLFKSLAGFFDELANEKKFAYVPDQKLRDRLKKAKPYLTHDGRVPTMIDLIEIFEGFQPVNSSYLNYCSDEDTKEYGMVCQEHFINIKREDMLSSKEAWQKYIDQPYSSNINQADLNIINDLFRGDHLLTKSCVFQLGSSYGLCPILEPFKTMSKLPFPKELVDLNEKMVDFVVSEVSKGTMPRK